MSLQHIIPTQQAKLSILMLYFTARLILSNQAIDARFNLNLLITNYELLHNLFIW